MIKLNKTEKRKYDVVYINGEEEENLVSLDLIFTPATNKFDKIVEFVEDCSLTLGAEFDDWFKSYITEYISSGYDSGIIKKNIPQITSLCDKYLEACEIDFDGYVDKGKVSKNSIFFDSPEIKKIVRVSNYLKLYFIISQDINLKLPIKFHREVYNELVAPITECDILHKLFKIVSSKTYKYNMSDSYMWEYIKTIYCKTTDMHIMSIFNFIVNNILVACDTRKNPIPFIITVVDESIRWILQSVYKDAVVYSDTINTEDTYSTPGKDNLKTYAYNDSIGKLVVIAYNYLEDHGISDVSFNESVKANNEISLFSTYLTYPILCKVLNIPYRHFLTIPAEHGYLLNILLYHHLPEGFKRKYSTIINLLLFYNKNKAISKTTYKIKDINHFTSTTGNFLGFKNQMFVYEFYSSIVGKIARNSYIGFKTGEEISNFPLAKLEKDLVSFYNDYFDGKLDEPFKEIQDKLDSLV